MDDGVPILIVFTLERWCTIVLHSYGFRLSCIRFGLPVSFDRYSAVAAVRVLFYHDAGLIHNRALVTNIHTYDR